MVLLRRTLNQGLPAEIAENSVEFLPRRGTINSGTIYAQLKITQPKRNPGVRETILKRKGVVIMKARSNNKFREPLSYF